jgi:hypothetical protein
MPPAAAAPPSRLVAKILAAALMMSGVLAVLVFAWVRERAGAKALEMPMAVVWVLGALGLGLLIVAPTIEQGLRRKAPAARPNDSDDGLVAAILPSIVVGAALREGACLIAAVIHLLTGDIPGPAILLAMGLWTMASAFPTDKRLDSWCAEVRGRRPTPQA